MKRFVNLLPLTYRRRCLVRRALAKWLIVWMTSIALSAAACGVAWHRSRSLQQDAVAIERSAAPLGRLVAEQTQMQTSLSALDAKNSVLGQVRSDRPPLSFLGAVSQSAARCKDRLVVQHLAFERKDKQPTAGNKPPQAAVPQQPLQDGNDGSEAWGSATIRGEATDNVAVATFVAGLRDSGLFRQVELKSCLRSPTSGRETRCYIVQCDI